MSDFLVAKTGSVPRNGEWDGYKAVVRLVFEKILGLCHCQSKKGLINLLVVTCSLEFKVDMGRSVWMAACEDKNV